MRKILIVRFSSLGDIVLALPLLQRLRAAYPTDYLAALTKEEYADVLKGANALNEVMTLAPGESISSVSRRVRRAAFDVILDLHANFRSRIVCALSGAARVVRYRKAALSRRLYVRWRLNSDDLKVHTLDRYLDTLRRLDPKEPLFLGSTPSKILLVQTAFLGDAVLTTPLLGALREQFPQTKITVLSTPEIAEVFERHPAVSEVIRFDKRRNERSWLKKWILVRRLAAHRFDLAMIPHRSLTSALLAWLAGIPRRVGFSTSQGRWLLTDVVPFEWGVHDVDRNLALLTAIGVQNPTGDLWLKPDEAARQRVTDRLRALGVKPEDKLVGINPGSVWVTKRWLPEGFAAVADRLIREEGARVVFIGGCQDEPAMRRILSMMKEVPINWVGQTTLKELMAVIARCRVFLTNDSGPLHIAVASHVPTVALFGPTTRELGFFPYGNGHTVIEKDLPCRPCGLHGADRCPLEHFQCMKLITAEEVFEAVKGKLLS
jgi:heptosyltransferase II